MLFLARFFRSGIIAAGLASLAVVLVPQYTEPLWNWARTITGVVADDPLPAFGVTQHYAALGLAAFVVLGVVYNVWRDRRHHRLKAEYAYRTGATHLKEKVADLQAQLRRMTAERDKWQDSFLSLTNKHTDALIASKEHEVRSEIGRSDRDALGQLRKDFESVMHAKGHIDGFREAMHVFLASMSERSQAPEVAAEPMMNGSIRDRAGRERRDALPFASRGRT